MPSSSSLPDHRICSKGSPESKSAARMAVAQTPKARLASKAGNGNGNGSGSGSGSGNSKSKSKSQMHRRSRTGCYTCRLRRKKCDEGTPMCTACNHLGLQCEYKRPMWWSNNDARRKHKEDIKNIIKRKKLAEKTSSSSMHQSASPPPPASLLPPALLPPPGLSHSLPTSSATSYSDAASMDHDDRTRSASIDSHYSGGFNFNSLPNASDFGIYNAHAHMHTHMHPDLHPADLTFAGYSPYDVDVKTERQMFVNDVPTLRESHVATFSGTYQTSPPPGTVFLPAAGHQWAWDKFDHLGQEEEEGEEEEALDVNLFDFAHGPRNMYNHNSSRHVQMELDDNDQRLLDHFVRFVLPIIFPILESNQNGCVGSDLILPALQSNRVYLHCCLSIAAQHLKTHADVPADRPADDVDGDIMRHRYATILSLCESLKRDENHQQILEATLGLIFFQCVVGRFDDGLLDIAWHQHFQAAISLVQKLGLPRLVSDPAGQAGPSPTLIPTPIPTPIPFNMTLTSWIDILGATMQGTSPTFAHTYREKHLSPANSRLGLRELMGCEDGVMYLISEVACLDSLKAGGMDDFTLCQHVAALGEQFTLTEVGEPEPRMPYKADGSFWPRQLCRNVTSAFRIAARIHLCSLIPGFSPSQPSPQGLIRKLTQVLRLIPSGPHGYDRSLVWVYLIAASVALPDSAFRAFFDDRVAQLSRAAACGAFGRMATLVREVWRRSDSLARAATPPSSSSTVVSDMTMTQHPHVNWRDVMRSKGWDFLLI